MDPKDMNSDDREKRLKELSKLSRPHKGTEQREEIDKLMSRAWANPAARERAKVMHKKAVATILAQQESGAGYPSDVALRELQMEYNSRLRDYGSSYMPASFDIAEAFFNRTTEFAGFLLYPETDYLISFTDFLDYITSPDSPSLDVGAAAKIPSNCTINVNSLDVPGELLLESGNEHGFSILGASYIRRGDEVAMLMVVGEQMPEEDLQHLRDTIKMPYYVPSNKRDLQPIDDEKAEVVYVDDDMRLVRDIALCRFNIKEKQLEVRCLLQDLGVKYNVKTDSPDVLRNTSSDPEALSRRMGEDLDKIGAVWEVAKMMLLLPAYLDARITLIQTEQRTTKYGLQSRNSLKFKRSVADALPESGIIFRRISAIRVDKPSTPQNVTGRSYTPPLFQVSVSGFWRHFSDPTQQGHDEEGNPVFGKTWVRSHVRHKDKADGQGPKVIYIKASLSNARKKLAEYRSGGARPVTLDTPADGLPTKPDGQDSISAEIAGAYVYVMRCPAHGRDIYKVGYTDRDPEQRARELSKTTATPTPFLVVQAWAVTNGRLAEQAAHNALNTCRVDGSREFFQSTYADLRNKVEGAILAWIL